MREKNKTLGLVSTTKRGRNLIKDKAIVGLSYSILVCNNNLRNYSNCIF